MATPPRFTKWPALSRFKWNTDNAAQPDDYKLDLKQIADLQDEIDTLSEEEKPSYFSLKRETIRNFNAQRDPVPQQFDEKDPTKFGLYFDDPATKDLDESKEGMVLTPYDAEMQKWRDVSGDIDAGREHYALTRTVGQERADQGFWDNPLAWPFQEAVGLSQDLIGQTGVQEGLPDWLRSATGLQYPESAYERDWYNPFTDDSDYEDAYGRELDWIEKAAVSPVGRTLGEYGVPLLEATGAGSLLKAGLAPAKKTFSRLGVPKAFEYVKTGATKPRSFSNLSGKGVAGKAGVPVGEITPAKIAEGKILARHNAELRNRAAGNPAMTELEFQQLDDAVRAHATGVKPLVPPPAGAVPATGTPAGTPAGTGVRPLAGTHAAPTPPAHVVLDEFVPKPAATGTTTTPAMGGTVGSGSRWNFPKGTTGTTAAKAAEEAAEKAAKKEAKGGLGKLAVKTAFVGAAPAYIAWDKLRKKPGENIAEILGGSTTPSSSTAATGKTVIQDHDGSNSTDTGVTPARDPAQDAADLLNLAGKNKFPQAAPGGKNLPQQFEEAKLARNLIDLDAIGRSVPAAGSHATPEMRARHDVWRQNEINRRALNTRRDQIRYDAHVGAGKGMDQVPRGLRSMIEDWHEKEQLKPADTSTHPQDPPKWGDVEKRSSMGDIPLADWTQQDREDFIRRNKLASSEKLHRKSVQRAANLYHDEQNRLAQMEELASRRKRADEIERTLGGDPTGIPNLFDDSQSPEYDLPAAHRLSLLTEGAGGPAVIGAFSGKKHPGYLDRQRTEALYDEHAALGDLEREEDPYDVMVRNAPQHLLQDSGHLPKWPRQSRY